MTQFMPSYASNPPLTIKDKLLHYTQLLAGIKANPKPKLNSNEATTVQGLEGLIAEIENKEIPESEFQYNINSIVSGLEKLLELRGEDKTKANIGGRRKTRRRKHKRRKTRRYYK
jgi:hypothetical protein